MPGLVLQGSSEYVVPLQSVLPRSPSGCRTAHPVIGCGCVLRCPGGPPGGDWEPDLDEEVV